MTAAERAERGTSRAGPGEITELLREVLSGADIDESVHRFIVFESAGSAAVARVVLTAALRAGAIALLRGIFVRTVAPIPPGAYDELLELLLEPDAEAAPFWPALRDLALLGTAPPERLVALSSRFAVGALQRTGTVTTSIGAATLTFVCPALATAIHDRIETPERRERLAELEAVVAPLDPPEHWPRSELLGYVSAALSCGHPVPLPALQRARTEIRGEGDYPFDRILTHAIAQHDEAGPSLRLGALAEQLTACLLSGAIDEAVAIASVGDRLLDEEPEIAFTARAAFLIARADLTQYHRDDLMIALRVLDDLEAELVERHPGSYDTDPDLARLAIELRVQRGVRLAWAGHAAAALTEMTSLLDDESVPDDGALLLLAAPCAILLAQSGQDQRALELVERFRDTARRSPTDIRARGDLIIAAYFTHLLAGRIGDAARLIAFAQEHTSAPRTRPRLDGVLLTVSRGAVELALGDATTAIRSFEAALAHYEVRDPHRITGYVYAHLSLARALDGDLPAARAAVEESRERLDGGGRVMRLLTLENCLRTEHWCGIDVHDRALTLADACRDEQLSLIELRLLQLAAAARPARASAMRERARELATAIATRSARVLAQHIDELADGVPRSECTAQGLLAQCGIPTPSQGLPSDLTARERDVVELALLRLPSRAIADRLGVSKRTVDSHLYRVYAKLGITSREELSAVFER